MRTLFLFQTYILVSWIVEGRVVSTSRSAVSNVYAPFEQEVLAHKREALHSSNKKHDEWCQTPDGHFTISTLVTTNNGSDLSELWGHLANDPHQRYAVFVLCWDKSTPCMHGKRHGSNIRRVPNDSLISDNQTWASNRNLLFQFIQAYEKKKRCTYRYYLFADADVSLINDTDITIFGGGFYNMLVEKEPALATPNNPWMKLPGIPKVDSLHHVLHVAYYDHNFVAIHHNASKWLLPYFTAWDSISWWWSGYVMNAQTLIQYLTNVTVLWELPTSNTAHDKNKHYKRGMMKRETWDKVVSILGTDLYDMECENIPLFVGAHIQDSWRLRQPDSLKMVSACGPYSAINQTCLSNNIAIMANQHARCLYREKEEGKHPDGPHHNPNG